MTMHHIRSVEELLPFFNTLCSMQQTATAKPLPKMDEPVTYELGGDDNKQTNGCNGEMIVLEGRESGVQSKMADDELIEHLVERDFLLIA